MVRLPLIAETDFRVFRDNLPVPLGNCCAANVRRLLSDLIVCQAIGLDPRRARAKKRRRSSSSQVTKWPERAARDGLFDRLTERGIFPGIDWHAIARGRFASEGFYYNSAPLNRIMSRYRPLIAEEREQRRRELAEAGCGAGDGFGFRSLDIGELDALSKPARRMLRRRSVRGLSGGADALSELGDDRYCQTINVLAADVGQECLKLARHDPDSKTRLDAWLSDNRPRGTSTLVAVPLHWIAPGADWTVHGVKARLAQDREGDAILDIDGDEFELCYLDNIPMDRATLTLVKRLPRMSVPPPF